MIFRYDVCCSWGEQGVLNHFSDEPCGKPQRFQHRNPTYNRTQRKMKLWTLCFFLSFRMYKAINFRRMTNMSVYCQILMSSNFIKPSQLITNRLMYTYIIITHIRQWTQPEKWWVEPDLRYYLDRGISVTWSRLCFGISWYFRYINTIFRYLIVLMFYVVNGPHAVGRRRLPSDLHLRSLPEGDPLFMGIICVIILIRVVYFDWSKFNVKL